ncbi:MAG: hypothetical protein GYA87_04135 [Christensenellaceae bacterium]|nr:hypothetical protein [Christensenellaceae bacterium]
MLKPFEFEYRLNARDVDFSSYCRVDRIFSLNQEVSGEHSEQLGMGVEIMSSKGLGWVLTRSNLTMNKYPKINDIIRFRTWPGKMRHGVFPRFVEIYLGNEIIGTSSNLYVQIDLNSRTVAEPFCSEELKNGINIKPLPFPDNIKNIESEIEYFSERSKYSDFDINLHVNNTSYIRWAFDLFSADFHKVNIAKNVLIHYNSEIRSNENIKLELQNKDSMSIIKGYTDKPCFTIQIDWMQK